MSRPWQVLALVIACGPVPRSNGGDVDAQTTIDAAVEICGNGIDDDRDGGIDTGCACYPGSSQACFVGDPALAGHGVCKAGMQTCEGAGEVGTWSACDGAVGPMPEVCNELDDDCNDLVDDHLPDCVIVDVMVNIDGDCVTASCPAMAPYPIGCNITMAGNDQRGCVASTPQGSSVYFQEGDKCGVGRVTGTLKCASVPGSALSAASCSINKTNKLYPPTRAGCPDT